MTSENAEDECCNAVELRYGPRDPTAAEEQASDGDDVSTRS